jgi:hypothetical protein
MPEESRTVKIRVKSGESEAEIEGSLSNMREAIELISEVLAKLPRAGAVLGAQTAGPLADPAASNNAEPASSAAQTSAAPSAIPAVTIEKGDSLSDVISKFFSDSWGRNPRKLMEVREALQSYGLNYPKQSVAVALLRLAKGSKLRRFKGEGGEYVYTASTGAARIPAPVQPVGPQQPAEAEAAPALETGVEQEDQLNLDAPAAN